MIHIKRSNRGKFDSFETSCLFSVGVFRNAALPQLSFFAVHPNLEISF